ncbi:protein kinase superfamily protein [Artemisia annua]|uniref:Protein kinase superfamily protein n=1 Tax=Artemisia annua TaxID=35608 RepID=A0A2U1N5B4_ARTAN|nr:protein kinase superfamily protein [Artemisia annua]
MLNLLFNCTVPVIFLRRFSYNDIKRATDGFSRVIATSSHGASYKAKFQGGRVAVVKEIHLIDQEDDYFYREVQLLGRLHHRHVVALDGFSVGRKRYPNRVKA